VQTRRWTNQSLPQTLQIAVLLLYLNAVVAFIFRSAPAIGLLVTVLGGGAAGYLISNEKKNGWYLGIAVAAFPLVLRLGWAVSGGAGDAFFDPLGLMFEIALLALLVHDQSRNYIRIWFK
jgi:hypothetical protein